MRAKFINEVNFERGQDPKKAMDVGARKDAPVLDRIVFDAWSGNSQDGQFIKKHYKEEPTHRFLKKLEDGDFNGLDSGVYRHPTRVRYYFKAPQAAMEYKELAGRIVRYEDEIYHIPKELAELPWKRREIY